MAWRTRLSCVDAILIMSMVRSQVGTTPKTLFGITYSLNLRNAISFFPTINVDIYQLK